MCEHPRINQNTRLVKGFDNIVRFRRTAFYRDHLVNIRIFSMGHEHAFSQENGFVHARSGFHLFAGEHFHLVKILSLPGRPDGRQHHPVDP